MTDPILPKSERDALILDARKHADRYAVKIARRAGHWDRVDDIRAEAAAGLVDASRRFDPARGVRFVTFAAFYIRLYCQRYIDDQTHAVRPSRGSEFTTVKYKIQPTERRLTQELQRAPTVAEMAEALGCTEYLLVSARWRRPDVSVSHGDYEEGHYIVRDRDPDALELVAEADARQYVATMLSRALRRLKGREREVIRLRFYSGEPPTLADIARKWGVSRERARQIEARAIQKMRESLERRGPEFMECVA